LDYRHSHFGYWLEAEGMERFGGQPLFASASESFKNAYILGAELCHLMAKGETTLAQTKLPSLHAARDEFLRQVRLLLQARQA
jgi:hypothetical protein